MDREDRVSGLWWMSDEPDNKIPGDLLVADRKLELHGSFKGMMPGIIGAKTGLTSVTKDKTIVGIAKRGGKKFTLEFFDDPGFTYTSVLDEQYKADTYSLRSIFEGVHLTQTQDLSFSKYLIELPYMYEWTGESIVSIKTTFSKGQPLRSLHSEIQIEEPKSITIYDSDRFDLLLSLYRGGLPLSGSIRNISVSQGCYLEIAPKDEISLDEARAIVGHFQRLLSIAVGRPVDPIRFEARTGARGRVVLHLRNASSEDYKLMHREEMNFSFQDIAEESQAFFAKWYGDMEKHIDMFDLYSYMQSGTDKNLNNQFRDVVGAIEGYVTVEAGVDELKASEAVKTLNEYLPEGDRLLDPSDYEKIQVTRNKLAHVKLRPGKEHLVMDMEQKWSAARKMQFLLDYALLKNLNAGDKILHRFYKKRKLYLV